MAGKYAKTKDGIYKQADYLGIHKGKRYALLDDAKGNRITMCQEPNETYETSDSLERLCDEWVLRIDGRCVTYKYCKSLNDAKRRYRDMTLVAYAKEQVHILGAIWTSKGLNFVAEANSEGKWELL